MEYLQQSKMSLPVLFILSVYLTNDKCELSDVFTKCSEIPQTSVFIENRYQRHILVAITV